MTSVQYTRLTITTQQPLFITRNSFDITLPATDVKKCFDIHTMAGIQLDFNMLDIRYRATNYCAKGANMKCGRFFLNVFVYCR